MKIKVISKNKTIVFCIDAEHHLSLECLKEYFPAANGLVYELEGVMEALIIQNGNLIINENVDTYAVHFANDECPDASPIKKAEINKANRINYYKQLIEGLQPSEEKPPIIQQSSTKKIKISDIRQISQPQIKNKLINIGWKHCISEKNRYKQQKIPHGGKVDLELDLSSKYSVPDIIDMAIKKYNDNIAVEIFNQSTVTLGFFNNIEIDSFSLSNGTECGIWDYYKHKNIPMNRINLYLLSTLKEKPFDDNDSDSEEIEIQNECNSKLKTNMKETENIKESEKNNYCDMEKNYDLEKKKNGNCDEMCQQIQEKESRVPFSDLTNFANIRTKKNDDITAEVAEALLSLVNPSTNEKPVELVKCAYNKVDVYYSIVNSSKYGEKATVTQEKNKFAIYWQNIYDNNDDGDNMPEVENFDPVNFGHKICKIVVNGSVLFHMQIDEETGTDYFFADSNSDDHSIVHDIDKVFGFSAENLGIGVVPKCTLSCQPMVYWYHNNVLYNQGIMMFWLHNIPVVEGGSTWYCQISCKGKNKFVSKRVKIMEQQPSNLTLNIISVSEVKKSDFEISKEVLGLGSQGTVYKGRYGVNDVAIKTIKIYSRKTKDIEREIDVLKSIRHKNFVTLMCVCRELKKIHLIMEYFPSKRLSDIIHDDDVKQEYIFNQEKKLHVSLEVCTGITYLHLQNNPIIHRDIKPDNILVNKDGQVKICDLGLSKFTVMITCLQTTTGGRTVGTIMYMAPEVFMKVHEATTMSDVWSTGCTILELFEEETVWDANTQNDMEQIFSNRQVPCIKNVPNEYKEILLRCLSYEENERPEIFEVLKEFSK